MQKNKTELLAEIASYYSERLEEHGPTPRGVDWNSLESQTIRFEQLSKVINPIISNFSLSDIGCGYGAYFDYLTQKYPLCSYLGVDISAEMIKASKLRYVGNSQSRFILASEPDVKSDYNVASGIFNVRLKRDDSEWFEYVESTLDILNSTSRVGFSFNCLTSYSEEDKKRDYLYYADPCRIFDLCKRRYSPQVALLHDYGLYEFTVVVRK